MGTDVNYMNAGVGPESALYSGGWKLMGVDESGRLLILSNESIIGKTISLGGKHGFENIYSILQKECDNYLDGVIGVKVRSVNVEDINNLIEFEKTSKNTGAINDYGNIITYSWDGTENPKYSYGNVSDNMGASHKAAGFTYYDFKNKKWVTSDYVESSKGITTIECTNYSYNVSDYMTDTSLVYKMFFRNAANTGYVDRYWLSSQVVSTTTDYVIFGSHIVLEGQIKVNNLFFADDYTIEPANKLRAVITLASDVEVEVNDDGEIDIK